MAIIKIKKRQHNFVVLDKASAQDERLTWRARGMLTYLVSLPDNWEVNVTDLINRSPDGKHIVYKIFKELKRFKYLTQETKRVNGKIASREYVIHEVPCTESDDDTETKHSDLLDPEFLDSEFQDQEDRTQLSNNINKKTNNKKNTAAKSRVDSCQYSAPQAEEQNAVAVSLNKNILKGQSLLISKILTEMQKQYVEKMSQKIILEQGLDANKLTREIEYALLDKNCFTQAGDDFAKKLNTILKRIKQGEWITPAGMVRDVQNEHKKEFMHLEEKLSDLVSQRQYFERMIDYAYSQKNKELVARREKDLEQVKNEIKKLQQLIVAAGKKAWGKSHVG